MIYLSRAGGPRDIRKCFCGVSAQRWGAWGSGGPSPGSTPHSSSSERLLDKRLELATCYTCASNREPSPLDPEKQTVDGCPAETRLDDKKTGVLLQVSPSPCSSSSLLEAL